MLFSILLPDTFPTALNARSILSDKAVIAMLSLAAMLPMIAGRIDLTVGYGIVLWHVVAISLAGDLRRPMAGRGGARACSAASSSGVVNGLLVEMAQIDSFIATLGTGTILYALAMWHTGGRQIMGTLPHGFTAISTTWVIGLPIGALLRDRGGARAVGGDRTAAARAASLRDRRQSESGGAERHSGARAT